MIKLRVRDDEGYDDEFVVEDDGAGGVQLRDDTQASVEASPSKHVDIRHGHCETCDMDIADQIGLTHDEVDTIRAWRRAKERGVSSSELSRILDKIVSRLEVSDTGCENGCTRIMLEVERA